MHHVKSDHDTKCSTEALTDQKITLALLNLSFSITKEVFSFLLENVILIVEIVILLLVFYVFYKSYISPPLYIRELTSVGFDHIKGPYKQACIERAQMARRLGSKLPPPYPNGWFAVAESMDLKRGDVKAANVLGFNLCVYRGTNGSVHCVDAYCPHLGANLAIGGSVCGDCIECPFHKWRFNGEGACVSVPGQDNPPKGVSIKKWPASEMDGAIWIWHHAEGHPPQWEIKDAEELKKWGYRGRNEFIVSSHVQDIPENGADVAHLNAVHSPSLLSSLGEKYPILLRLIGQHCWSAEWTRGEDHTAKMHLKHDYRIGKYSMFHIDALASQMGPGHVRLLIKTVGGPMLISQSVTPLSPLEQKVIHRVFSPTYNAPVAAGFLRGESYMFERDIAVWNHKRFVGSPAYIKTDKTIRAFRSWFSQFYSENSISFSEALKIRSNPLDW